MYTTHCRVAASETDETATLTLLSAVTMMQNTSILWMEREPVLAEWLAREDAVMMVASREVELRRRADFGENLTVSTWIYRMTPRMGYRNTCIFDGRGQCVAACWAVGVFVARDGRGALKLPPDVLDSFEIEPAFDMGYGKRKIAVPAGTPEQLAPVRVQHSDIDLNGHMNNARYVRIALDLLPDGIQATHLRITHDGQARLGQPIVPTRIAGDGSCYFALRSETGELFAAVELS